MNEFFKYVTWQNWVYLIAGLWVSFLPWTFSDGFHRDTVNVVNWNLLLSGLLVFGVTLYAQKQRKKPWTEWLIFFIGGWLMFSPWFLGYHYDFMLTLNSIALGLIILVASLTTIPDVERRIYHRINRKKDTIFFH